MLEQATGVVVNGQHFQIAEELPLRDRSYGGFGGRRHVIRFNDGREVVTTNLWTQGHIPAQFRNRFPENATFVQESTNAK